MVRYAEMDSPSKGIMGVLVFFLAMSCCCAPCLTLVWVLHASGGHLLCHPSCETLLFNPKLSRMGRVKVGRKHLPAMRGR